MAFLDRVDVAPAYVKKLILASSCFSLLLAPTRSDSIHLWDSNKAQRSPSLCPLINPPLAILPSRFSPQDIGTSSLSSAKNRLQLSSIRSSSSALSVTAARSASSRTASSRAKSTSATRISSSARSRSS